MSDEKWKTYEGQKTCVDYKTNFGLHLKNDNNEFRTDYRAVLGILHPDINWKHVKTDGYHGDVVSLGIDKHGRFFYKNNSFGSCSGCDWMKSIKNEEEAEEFLKYQETLDKIGKNKYRVLKYLVKETANVWSFEIKHLKEFIEFMGNVTNEGKYE